MSALTRMLRRHGELWTMSASEKVVRDEYEDEEPVTPVTTTFKAIRSDSGEDETEERGDMGQSRFERLELLVPASLDIVEEKVSETFRVLSLPGPGQPTGNYAESPPDPAFDVLTGDIDWRVNLKMPDFSPSPSSQKIINKFDGGVGLERSWFWTANGNGTHQLDVGAGLGQPSFTAFNQVPAELNGTYLWLRWSLDIDNGNGEKEATFYYSLDGIDWVVVNVITQAGVIASVNAVNSSNIGIGSQSTDLGQPLAADILEVQIRNGRDGPIVYNPIFKAQPLGTTLFQDAAAGVDVTVLQNGSPQAEIVDEVQPTRTVVGDPELPITLTSPEGRTFNLIGIAKSGVPVGAKRLLLRSGGADAAVHF